jgi:hypothetical protein
MNERTRHAAVPAIAAGLFCLILIYLALQVRAGNDPAIGAGEPAVAQGPRQVIVRRVIIRRIVEEESPRAPAHGTPAEAAAPTESAAPAPAPAAPPAPAPVVSRGS